MSSEIFDQASLKHPKARRFAEAFEGCGEWITLPSRRGESSVFDFRRHEPDLDQPHGRTVSGRTRFDRAA
jgi:hypothetical protein